MNSQELFHREIEQSTIPNDHISYPFKVFGVRVGLFFWIMGGPKIQGNNFFGYRPQSVTSLWSFLQDKWTQGPELSQNVADAMELYELDCVQALNSSLVLFLGLDQTLIYYNFDTNEWTFIQNRKPTSPYKRAACIVEFNKMSTLLFVYAETAFEGHWIAHDLMAKTWKVVDRLPLYFVSSIGNIIGKLTSLQGRIIYFYMLIPLLDSPDASPVFEILINGTVIDLKRPFYFEEEQKMEEEAISVFASTTNFVPFLKRNPR